MVGFGQDMLLTQSLDTLKVSITEIDQKTGMVAYKKLNNPSGPTYHDYATNFFLVLDSGTDTIWNDPYENPKPGSREYNPVSLRHNKFELTEKERTFAYWNALNRLEHNQRLEKIFDPNCVDKESWKKKEAHFKKIFDNVLAAARKYCRARGFEIVDDFDWEYTFMTCDYAPKSDSCRMHGDYHLLQDFNERFINARSFGFGKLEFYELFFLSKGMSDDAIAAIVGHEIGHAIAQHNFDRKLKDEKTGKTVKWVSALISLVANQNYREVENDVAFLAYAYSFFPYARAEESEADKMGIVFMAMAGYDPKEAVDFWRSLGGEKHAWNHCHPAPMERAWDLMQFIETEEFKKHIARK